VSNRSRASQSAPDTPQDGEKTSYQAAESVSGHDTVELIQECRGGGGGLNEK